MNKTFNAKLHLKLIAIHRGVSSAKLPRFLLILQKHGLLCEHQQTFNWFVKLKNSSQHNMSSLKALVGSSRNLKYSAVPPKLRLSLSEDPPTADLGTFKE